MIQGPRELRRYRTASGRVPFSDWLADLDDETAARVSAYVDRMKGGNFGDSEPVGNGVSELRINVGPGYRVYYVRDGQVVILLLCGGDKGTQTADIRKACEYAADYRSRLRKERPLTSRTTTSRSLNFASARSSLWNT